MSAGARLRPYEVQISSTDVRSETTAASNVARALRCYRCRMVSRYEPVITINAMVKVGRWTIGPVYWGPPRQCDRCGTVHNYVYVCTIDPDVPDEVVREKLLNERVWWVGSTCGPTLAMVSDAEWTMSDEEWTGSVKLLKKSMMLAIRATRTIDEARRQGYDDSLLPYVLEDLALLLKNELSPRRQRRTGRLLTFIEGWLKRKAEAAEAGAPPPPAPQLHPSARDVLAAERKPGR